LRAGAAMMVNQAYARLVNYLSQSLAQRFAVISTVLAIIVLLTSGLGSWWLAHTQVEAADRLLMQKEVNYGANLIGATLRGVISRIDEMAESSLLITALTDSAGRESYLYPYLSSINSVNGIPISILLTDNLGNEIGNNRHGNFSAQDYIWLVEQILRGKNNALIQDGEHGAEIIAVQLISSKKTGLVQGALLYKFPLAGMLYSESLQLIWKGQAGNTHPISPISAVVELPGAFDHLGFQVDVKPNSRSISVSLMHLSLMAGLTLMIAAMVLSLGRRLALVLTRQLRILDRFSREVVQNGFGSSRALVEGGDEVSSLAQSINHMLDALHEQHLKLQNESDRRDQLLERYRLLVENTHAILWEMMLPEYQFIFVSQQAENLFAHQIEQWKTGEFSSLHLHLDDADRLWGLRTKAARTGNQYRCEYRFQHKNGNYLWVEEIGSVVRDAGNEVCGLRGIMFDISQRKLAEQEIERLAFYDPLTSLPNRRMLTDFLQGIVDTTDISGAFGVVIFIDLDNFKTLNDTYGHDVGDLFLMQAANRLKNAVRVDDMVARLGGDEFIIVVQADKESSYVFKNTAERIATNIIHGMDSPFQLEGNEYLSTASLGMYFYNAMTDSVTDMLQRADLAMYHTKENGRNNFSIFNPEMQTYLSHRTSMETKLRHALRNQEFILYYQPQVSGDGKTLGFEALLRWQNPELGLVEQGQFIALAEETGLILDIGAWVIEEACRKLVEWQNSPQYAALTLSVNVSVRQFAHKNFIEQTVDTVTRAGVNSNLLKLELTESLLMNDIEAAIQKIWQLKSCGFRFSLDDFGTGYSSLSYLRRLPLDELKIDRSFFSNLLVDEKDAAIVRTIVVLAKNLGLGLIAEGVENEAQRAVLASYGCSVYQGYLYGVPLDEEKLQSYLTTL
jgi:diguanylate cyclase (GGDEF)-like protein/PAS domain S-box-containing protein